MSHTDAHIPMHIAHNATQAQHIATHNAMHDANIDANIDAHAPHFATHSSIHIATNNSTYISASSSTYISTRNPSNSRNGNHPMHNSTLNNTNINMPVVLNRPVRQNNPHNDTNIIVPVQQNNSNNKAKNNSNNKATRIKNFLITIFIITYIFQLASNIYNIYVLFKTTNHVNEYIKTLNETQIEDHKYYTYDVGVLMGLDIVYYILFIINIILFKKVNCYCTVNYSYCVLPSILFTLCIIHGVYIHLANKYINDDKLQFESSYHNSLVSSSVLYYFFCGLILFIGIITYWYLIKNSNILFLCR
jgi:hypothetical protein